MQKEIKALLDKLKATLAAEKEQSTSKTTKVVDWYKTLATNLKAKIEYLKSNKVAFNTVLEAKMA